ncbi:4-(cytidine 5'-diphospho)-2-C-methyl-D-erythritol kinase [Fournierella massiliensis]|nr:4-(cytidine 5'-diphospho)-2-C-methyl-D-erythritol kinase [Fournierella massiliensis]MCF2556142.1 4-(cytidine 5'-diphospho)-2-C-methyl-D-erythritol kinase [Fournierella massiliensis]
MDKVTVLAPAKLNLSLDIVGLLPGGYHALDMVMQAVTLYEKIELEKSREITLELPGSPLKADEKNTAWQAARRFLEAAGIRGGARITVHKAIPAQAGMAGGSADAAAVLVGLNRLYGGPLSFCRLLELGAQVGADVPFSLMGGTCRVQGKGDILKALPPCPDCRFVIVMPEEGVSTPAAFARYDRMPAAYHPDVEALEEAVRKKDLSALCGAAGNALQPCSGTEETEHICRRLRQEGAITALMTGSGAAVFGIFADEAGAEQARRTLQGEYRQVYLTAPDTFGARVTEEA